MLDHRLQYIYFISRLAHSMIWMPVAQRACYNGSPPVPGNQMALISVNYISNLRV